MNKTFSYHFLFLLLLLSIFTSSYSVLIYDPNQGYGYFVNSSNLDIELDLQTKEKPLLLKKAQIRASNNTFYEKELEINLIPGKKNTVFLNVNTFENNGSFYTNALFEEQRVAILNLSILKLNGEEYIDESLPKEVSIILYNPTLYLQDTKFLYYKNDFEVPKIRILGDENNANSYVNKAISFRIYDSSGSLLTQSSSATSYSPSDLIDVIDLHFLENLDIGIHTFTIEFTNIAGSVFKETFSVTLGDEKLDILLLTSKDNPTLEYFYSDNTQLYGNTIYVGEKNFKFSIQTNKQSHCYINLESMGVEEEFALIDYNYFDDENLYSELTSKPMIQAQNSFTYSVNISPFFQNDTSRYFWVGCEDSSGLERISLHESIDSLLSREQNLQFVFHDEELLLDLEYPSTDLLTDNTFTTRLLTSTQAICSLSILNTKQLLVHQQGQYLDHWGTLQLEDGDHTLRYSCIDVLNHEKTYEKTLTMDSTLGVKINLESMYYSAKNQFSLSFTTSEIVNSCRYAKEPKKTSLYNTSQLIGSNTNTFNVTFPLSSTENKFFITCKAGLFSTKESTIIFDQAGPKISNLTFSANGFKSQKYVPKDDDVELEFNVNTLIPLKEYEVELIGKNGSQIELLSASSSTGTFEEEIRLREELGEFTSLKITPINILNQRGNTLSSNLLFDITQPEVTFLKSGNFWVLTCTDIETSCSKVFYGFSNSLISCNPSYTYTLGELIDATEYTTICARALNSVGLLSDTITKATGNTLITPINNSNVGGGNNVGGGGNVGTINQSNGDGDTNSNEQPINGNNESGVTVIEDPTNPGQVIDVYVPEDDESSAIIILSALAAILLVAGGTGYYAYKKGYLNTQLQKLGIKLPNQGTATQGSSNYYSPISKNNSTAPPTLTGNSGDKKSKYDEHLSKLNSFLDETLDKKKGVFDSFKTSQKGRVENYNDTLAKPKVGSIKKDQDFDEFYKASSSKSLNTSTSSEDEADKFEDYYKKKKDTTTSKEDNKKQ